MTRTLTRRLAGACGAVGVALAAAGPAAASVAPPAAAPTAGDVVLAAGQGGQNPVDLLGEIVNALVSVVTDLLQVVASLL